MKGFDGDDLGFVFRITKCGHVEIRHNGKFATRFSGTKALRIAGQLTGGNFSAQQQLMARLTGNYKHGNEKNAKNAAQDKYQQ